MTSVHEHEHVQSDPNDGGKHFIIYNRDGEITRQGPCWKGSAHTHVISGEKYFLEIDDAVNAGDYYVADPIGANPELKPYTEVENVLPEKILVNGDRCAEIECPEGYKFRIQGSPLSVAEGGKATLRFNSLGPNFVKVFADKRKSKRFTVEVFSTHIYKNELIDKVKAQKVIKLSDDYTLPDGKGVIQADTESLQALVACVSVMTEGSSTPWVMSDNSVVDLSVDVLRSAVLDITKRNSKIILACKKLVKDLEDCTEYEALEGLSSVSLTSYMD